MRVCRIFNTYGPRMALDDGRVVSNFVTQALTNQPMTVYGDGQQTRSFQYVSDLVAGMVAVMEGEGAVSKPRFLFHCSLSALGIRVLLGGRVPTNPNVSGGASRERGEKEKMKKKTSLSYSRPQLSNQINRHPHSPQPLPNRRGDGPLQRRQPGRVHHARARAGREGGRQPEG